MEERPLVSRIMAMALAVAAPISLQAQSGLFKIRDCRPSAHGLVHGAKACSGVAEGPARGRGKSSVIVLLNSQSTLNQRVFHLQVYSSDQRPFELAFDAHESFAIVASRDVNRDGAFDLVVEQSLTRRPLQVWLNDGHGHFTPASTSRFRLRGREPPRHVGASQSGKTSSRHRSPVKRGSKLILDRVPALSDHAFLSPQHSVLCVSADEQEPRGSNPSRAPPASFLI